MAVQLGTNYMAVRVGGSSQAIVLVASVQLWGQASGFFLMAAGDCVEGGLSVRKIAATRLWPHTVSGV